VRFDHFELDLQSGELCHHGNRLLLSDQPFRLLAILLRQRGSLVTREDLRHELWPEGTFVDFERSLNAAVKRLREALGDSAAAPRFIETLPRRGYRFIATVDDIDPPATGAAAAAAVGPVPADPTSESDDSPVPALPPPKSRKAGGTLVFVSGAIAALSVLVAILLTGGKPDGAAPAAAYGPRLTSLGTVRLAALSPDGQRLAYVRTDDVRESLWVRKIDGDTPIQLVGPMDGFFRSLTFGPDGFVYYTLLRPDLTAVPLRRVPVNGGAPERVLQASGGVSFSPDGSQYAYVSTTSLGLQESRIVVTDARGGASRAVAVKRSPDAFVRIKPAWSPDGAQLAVVSTSEAAPAAHEILIIDLGDGGVRKTASVDRLTVSGLLWLADRTGLVMSASGHGSQPRRLWHLSLSSGAVRPLTHDVSDYSLAGITPDGRSVVAVRADVARNLWVAEVSRLSGARQIAGDSGELSGLEGLSWAPDGRLFYGSAEAGNVDIWSYDAATDTQRQITSDPAEEFHPAVSPDGRTIAFATTGAGSGIWAVSSDGRGRRRLTTGNDTHPTFFPDGGSVAFQRIPVDTLPFTVERVAITGGMVTRIGSTHTMRPAVSPDGRFVAHYWMTPDEWRLGITRVGESLPLRSLALRPTHSGRVVRWSPDGASLAFIDGEGGAWNIWTQPVEGGSARKLTHFTEGRIATFDWSLDGSRLAWTRINEVRDIVIVDIGPALARGE
jgi:Tol biopolymer transport system component/DNA-binding winged helix-turn-helix (wHTH) protein